MTEQADSEIELAHGYPSPTLNVFWYLFTSGAYEIWRRAARVTVTNRKVTIGHGVVKRRTRTLPVPSIQSVSRTRLPGIGKVVITTAGGAGGVVATKWMSGGNARRVEQAVTSLIEQRDAVHSGL